MPEPLVSVVVPCYQQGRYLGQTIESVLSQTYGRVEIVVVDDGSTDDTAAVAAGYSERVVYYRQPNQGLSAARNAGIRISQGEWIQLLDADDLLEPGKIAQQVRVGTDRCVDVVWGPYGVFTDDSPEIGPPYADFNMPGDDAFRSFAMSWERGFSIPIHCMLFRRECFDRWGWFDTRLKNHEDWDCHLRFSAGGAKYAFADSERALYRITGVSMSRGPDAHAKMRVGKFQCLEQLIGAGRLSRDARRVLSNRYISERQAETVTALRERRFRRAVRQCSQISIGHSHWKRANLVCWAELVARVAGDALRELLGGRWAFTARSAERQNV